jgi:hypothetical protein
MLYNEMNHIFANKDNIKKFNSLTMYILFLIPPLMDLIASRNLLLRKTESLQCWNKKFTYLRLR